MIQIFNLQDALHNTPPDEMKMLITKIREMYKQIKELAMMKSNSIHSLLQQELEKEELEKSKSLRKHLLQQASPFHRTFLLLDWEGIC